MKKSENLSDKELANFFDWFFEIGYSEIVFADKAIFYEGDTERLFIRKAMTLEKYKKLHQGETFLINRNKGLGEQDPDELAEALLNPETRNIAQLVIKDKKSTENLIEMLLGPNVPPRRAYLLAHSEEANDND